VAESPDDPEKSIQYGQEIVGQLLALTKMIRTVGAVFIGLLGFISLIFINNSIRLAIYARRKEIGIMRLVGASNWFIRTPFLMEGVIQSLVGAFLAIGTLAIVWVYLLPRAREVLGFLRFELPLSAAASISLILIASGIIVGLIGSGLALRRYLKV
jgi:cell division transport system permease protein